MFTQLTGGLKQRIIKELREYWAYDCQMNTLAENIQGSYAFKSRAQMGIIVRFSGASHVRLSADNYIGLVESYVTLAKDVKQPGLAIEWVREDSLAIQRNGGRFPSPAGVYYVEVWDSSKLPNSHTPPNCTPFVFYVDQMLDIRSEILNTSDCQTFSTQNPILPGSLRVYEQPSNFLLQEGGNYTVNPSGNFGASITLNQPLDGNRWLTADYRAPGFSTPNNEPFQLFPNRANNRAIPGVVLAFGRKLKHGDKMAILVTNRRTPSNLSYGGHWDTSMELEIFARDDHTRSQILGETLTYLQGILRPTLANEGIHIEEVSAGGESEEVYDETGDDYYYLVNISMTVKVDWFVDVPLTYVIRNANTATIEDLRRISGLPCELLDGETGNIRVLNGLNLDAICDPFFKDRSKTFETIR